MNAHYELAASLVLCLCATPALAVDAGAGTAATAVRRTLTPDDLYRVEDVSDPRVSPDGQWVAYVVTTNDRGADEAQSAIWMASWDGRQRLALTRAAPDTGKPAWSPDGRYLAYLAASSDGEKGRLMLLDRRGGEARPLTSVSSAAGGAPGDVAGGQAGGAAGGEVGEYAWSPDGKRIALAMQPGDDGETPKSPKPIVIDALHFKDDADGYLPAGRARHIYVFDLETRHLEALTSDARFNEDRPVWSPDGRQIAFIRTREKGPDPDGKMDIDVIDARAGADAHPVTRPFAPNAPSLAWSPDGKWIAYLQGLEPKFNAYMQDRLFVVPAAGGAPRALTDQLDRAVTSFAFTADSAAIAITVEDDGTAYPARVALATGAIARERAGRSVVSALTSAAGHTAVLETSDAALNEVYALEDGQTRKLTAHTDELSSGLTLGAVEDIRFKSRDGTDVHGLLVKPPSFAPGRRYPMILWIHGGPNGQDEHSLALDGYQFEPQMFAAKGFLVLRVNYRGGSGRGLAYAKTIAADWGHKEVEDLLAGVDYLVAQGLADKDRLGIGGWSYGGILTDYTIATDRRFKAAISGAGSGNQLSTYGTDEYILQYNNELGPPWNNTALWLKVSYPFFHADRIHTPTLFLGGDKDFNVPIAGGEQMYQALRTRAVPAQLVVYPGEHHVFSRPSFVKDLADRMSDWLDRFITP